jgi:hypothetical protein
LFGHLNNTAQLLDVLNATLDGIGVVGPSSVQDIFVFLNLTFGPRLVGGSAVLRNTGENAEQTESDDGFLVQNVKLVANGGDGKTGTGGKNGRLGDKRTARKRIQDRLSLLLGLLSGDVGVQSNGRKVGCDGRDVMGSESRPHAGGAYNQSGHGQLDSAHI